MRSSKSRSRNKNNRRSVGNIVNRVFDSSGPEGKVRGTPQQIIDKYLTLARDAQLASDRVAVENFQQHAEHYTRMLGEAQREQDARREAQEAQQRERQQRDRGGDQGRDSTQGQDDPGSAPQPDVVEAAPTFEVAGDGDSGLVETPEEQSGRKQRGRGRRGRKSEGAGDGAPDAADAPAAEATPEAPAAE